MTPTSPRLFSTASAVVRYQVRDVERAVAFYVERLGFTVSLKVPVMAIASRGELHLLLSGPGTSGARPMPDGRQQDSGGWNRIVLYVDDLDATIAALTRAEVSFRNAVESGPGGRQIMLDDPDGNPIELHEVPRGAQP
jgi:glyoxylase I family protein